MIRGEVVWFFAYDVAFEAKLEQAAELLAGRSPGFRKPARYRGTPQDMLTYPSLGLELPEGAAADLPGAPGVGRAVKLFPVGAVSVTLRVPFEEPALDDLMPCCLLGEIEGSELRKLARASAEEMVQAVGASLVKPLPNWDRCEAYKAVCITAAEGLDKSARGWLAAHRPEAAALLLAEGPPEDLAAEQVNESLRLAYAFTESDLAVVDWNGMLVLDSAGEYEELLYTAEVANLLLAELRAHDELLERSLDRAYDDLEAHRQRPALFRTPAKLAHALREQRIDLARMADEILNLSKYFGDSHLARIYQGLEQRFGLAEWEQQLERKLRTVDSLYEMIAREISERRMLLLEAMIVVLFIIDLIIIVLQNK